MVNYYMASIRLGHVLGSLSGKEVGDVIINAKFDFTLVTDANENSESYKEMVIMCGIDDLHKSLKECACTEDWLGMLHCSVCPTTGLKAYTANVHQEHGRGSNTIQEPGDILMSVDHKFSLLTAPEETPVTHKEQVVRVIDELYKSLKECACAPDFWEQQ